MKTTLKNTLRKISRIFFYLTPKEFLKNNIHTGVYQLLIKEKDEEIFQLLSEDIKKSIPFDDTNKIRKYAIELAISNKNIVNKENFFYLEFGVFKGAGANLFSEYVEKIYAFDSFEGLPNEWVGELPKSSFNLNRKIPRLKKNVIPIVGKVENTLGDFLEKNVPKINFVHFDLDLYEPTKYALLKIKPYLERGSIILFDELYNYINWKEGEYKALIEVFKKSEYKYKAFRINGRQAVIEIL